MYVVESIFAIVVCSVPLLIAEWLVRNERIVESPILRKIVHVAASVSTIIAAITWGLSAVAVAGAVFLLVFIVSRLIQLKWRSLDNRWQKTSYGDMAFATGVAIAALTASDIRTFIYIMLVVGIADTAGWVVGSRFKKLDGTTDHQAKSMSGTLAVFAVAVLLGLIVLEIQAILTLIMLAVAVAAVERFTPRGWDNATIPAAILLLLAV